MFHHRDSFERTLNDNRTDPLNSTRSYSFRTTYECACVILDSTINLYGKSKCLAPKVWRIWSNVFCAAVGNVLHPHRIAAHHNFLKLFPGRNRNCGRTYPERKSRTMSPSEIEGCMWFIRKGSQSRQLCIECSRTYSCAYDSWGSVNKLYLVADIAKDARQRVPLCRTSHANASCGRNNRTCRSAKRSHSIWRYMVCTLVRRGNASRTTTYFRLTFRVLEVDG